MPNFRKLFLRPDFVVGALGAMCLPSGQALAVTGPASAGYAPDFTINLNTDTGLSSETTIGLHPTGELGFAFFGPGEKSCVSGICLDLSVLNSTVAPETGISGVLSSKMISAGFNLPSIAGLAVNGITSVQYVADTLNTLPPLYSPCGPANDCRPGAFSNLVYNGVISGPASGQVTFDLCPTSQTGCQSGGKPVGLNNGEFTIARFLIPYTGTLSAAEIASEFFDFFSYPVGQKPDSFDGYNIIGRWQAVDCQVCSSGGNCETVRGGSDKITGGNPVVIEPPIDPETQVPGPLPILGAASAWVFSRRLRRRVQVGQGVLAPVRSA